MSLVCMSKFEVDDMSSLEEILWSLNYEIFWLGDKGQSQSPFPPAESVSGFGRNLVPIWGHLVKFAEWQIF